MAEEAPLKPIRDVLLKIRNAADAALKRIDQPTPGFQSNGSAPAADM